jgi:two-component system, LytTR family, sensor kinase
MSLASKPWRKVAAMTETQTDVRSMRWIWIAAMWVAGALFEAGQSVPFMRAMGKQHAWLIFGTELASWVPWALATPLVIALARR